MIERLVGLIFWLLVAHAITDFPLQGDFLARAKNHTDPIEGVPWPWALAMHALISGGGVALVTGSIALGCVEALVHGLIDYAKCGGAIDFTEDQLFHVACKLVWALAAVPTS